ncbi:MAG: NAD(P)H-dependent oxidoreductase subunit E [Spirochaetia bacterium]
MKKTKIKICIGTACYVMGASEILMRCEDLISEGKGIVLEGATCLGLCKEPDHQGPPFVFVGDRLIPRATPEKVIEAIDAQELEDAGQRK